MNRGIALLVVLLVWLAATGGTVSPAQASCVEIPPMPRAIREAEILFVGTVVETANSARWATVEVEEVWKGKRIPEVVEIHAGPADPPGPMSVASSGDRTYKQGVRYLFFPYRAKDEGGDRPLQDSSCSRTTRFTPRLERFRPAAPAHPAPVPDDPGGLLTPMLIVVLLGGAAVAAVVMLARRRREEKT